MMNVAPETPLRGRQMPMDDGETPPPVCPFWTQATQAQQILGPVAQVGEASPIEQDSRTCALRWDFFGYMIIIIIIWHMYAFAFVYPAWICIRQSFDLSFHGTAFGWEHGHTDVPPGRDPLPN
jgi:hypothetical protein